MKKIILLILLMSTAQAALISEISTGYFSGANTGDVSEESVSGATAKVGVGYSFGWAYLKLSSQYAMLSGDIESGDIYAWGVDLGIPLGPFNVYGGYDFKYVYLLDGFQPVSGNALRVGLSYQLFGNIYFGAEYTIGTFTSNGGAAIDGKQGLNGFAVLFTLPFLMN